MAPKKADKGMKPMASKARKQKEALLTTIHLESRS